MERHTLVRSMHDVGLAAWFGGSLMGAVGLNGAAAGLRDPSERSSASTAGWTRWAPVNAAAIGAHLIGAAAMLRTEQRRIRHQDGVARSSAIKTGLTVAALGTTAYSGLLNRKMAAAGPVPVDGATEPGSRTPPQVARTLKQLKAVQWLIPALTGSLVSVTSWHGEQMRPQQVARGILPGGRAPVAVVGVAAALLVVRTVRARRTPSPSAPPLVSPVHAPAATTPSVTVTAPPSPVVTPPRDVDLDDIGTRTATTPLNSGSVVTPTGGPRPR